MLAWRGGEIASEREGQWRGRERIRCLWGYIVAVAASYY